MANAKVSAAGAPSLENAASLESTSPSSFRACAHGASASSLSTLQRLLEGSACHTSLRSTSHSAAPGPPCAAGLVMPLTPANIQQPAGSVAHARDAVGYARARARHCLLRTKQNRTTACLGTKRVARRQRAEHVCTDVAQDRQDEEGASKNGRGSGQRGRACPASGYGAARARSHFGMVARSLSTMRVMRASSPALLPRAYFYRPRLLSRFAPDANDAWRHSRLARQHANAPSYRSLNL